MALQVRQSQFLMRRATRMLALLTVLVLLLSLPSSLRYLRENHGFYLFSQAFVDDVPRRLTGPGKFRFVLQPLGAIILGIRSGLSDAKAGRPSYLSGLLLHREHRGHFLRSSVANVLNLLLMGILVDSICQWLILGDSYMGAAMVVGPVLIVMPYTVARSFTNRIASLRN